MNYLVRDYQARVNAILNRPALVIDGMKGPKTREGIAMAMKVKGVRRPVDIFHDSGIHGIIWHWTASKYPVTDSDIAHYNDLHDYLGNSFDGAAPAQHQANYDWRREIGVSHTKNANSGRIGQACVAMHGAEGWPKLNWGNFPLTWEGIDAMLERSAEYHEIFDIPVTEWSMMSHAEVQGTLGIRQNNKWDFMVLPEMEKVTAAKEVGNILRKRLKDKFL